MQTHDVTIQWSVNNRLWQNNNWFLKIQVSQPCIELTTFIIIIINVVHEVQNKYKHKRKAKRKAKKKWKAKNMTVTTSLYAQIFYGRTDVIFANSTVR